MGSQEHIYLPLISICTRATKSTSSYMLSWCSMLVSAFHLICNACVSWSNQIPRCTEKHAVLHCFLLFFSCLSEAEESRRREEATMKDGRETGANERKRGRERDARQTRSQVVDGVQTTGMLEDQGGLQSTERLEGEREVERIGERQRTGEPLRGTHTHESTF